MPNPSNIIAKLRTVNYRTVSWDYIVQDSVKPYENHDHKVSVAQHPSTVHIDPGPRLVESPTRLFLAGWGKSFARAQAHLGASGQFFLRLLR